MAAIIKRPRIGWRDAEDAYIVTSANNRVLWNEGAGLLSATIAEGIYSDLELAGLVKIAMDATGGTYSITRDGDTELFDVTRLDSADPFTLYACSLFFYMGYSVDHSGAVSYDADLPTPAMVYLELTEPVRSPEYTHSEPQKETHRSLSGRRRSTSPEAQEYKWEADLRFPSYAALETFLDFIGWATGGACFRWWPDRTDWTRWVLVQLLDDEITPEERLPIFKNWTIRIELGQAGNNTGTIELSELQDR